VEINVHLHALDSVPWGEATLSSQTRRLDGPKCVQTF